MKKVVIIGAGFGGLNAAKILAGNKDFSITILDKENHHLFKPLLYQVASAGLNESDIAYPIRSIFAKNENVKVFKENVVDIDGESKKVITDSKIHEYDYLIIACGAVENYFKNSNWISFAPPLQKLSHAQHLRNKILNAFEMAEKSEDDEERKKHLTFVIVGGGPTGVELAGAIGEITRITLTKDFRNIDPSLSRIILIEANNTILRSFDKKLIKKALRDLESLGVQIWNSSKVTDIREDSISIASETLKTSTIMWAAGTMANSLAERIHCDKDQMGKILVENDLSLNQFPDVYAVGDIVHFEQNGRVLPGLAPVAMQQGKYAAKVILKREAGKPYKPFKYRDKGQLATIGRSKAIAEIKRFKVSGTLAWITWLFVHVLYLTGFKNRMLVMLQWAWSYFTFKKGARIIIDK
ncbi:NAD(P)/FAD-dependent oxidoreductase [Flexistipes sp.]|uniref:NAD(P)/FAD-dependent oxidoreductase n=1 Tax=Flexistipes sp. TaxID=3088135 RepID=UPI002E1D5440|nr:NAD(P)/FAD-dependent oxidoreductase [Flexistipes sp.]